VLATVGAQRSALRLQTPLDHLAVVRQHVSGPCPAVSRDQRSFVMSAARGGTAAGLYVAFV
jgi:hypothetical protein